MFSLHIGGGLGLAYAGIFLLGPVTTSIVFSTADGVVLSVRYLWRPVDLYNGDYLT
jgi:hypothetical protein